MRNSIIIGAALGTVLAAGSVYAADGKAVFNQACTVCHSQGVAGAPKFGDAEAWAPRIAKGKDTLYQHAINGFTGDSGTMPPKGGFTNLSDDDVKAAVDYMVENAQK
jgi:cytochrome c5